MDNVVFIVGMGIGKNIMGTVPLRGVKKKYPDAKITVVASHPEVFRGNPNVDMVYQVGATPNFWELYKGALILKSEPYYHRDFLAKKKHLSEVWCEQLDVPFDNTTPEIFLNHKEKKKGLEYVRGKNKPVLLMQFQGGAAPQAQQQGQGQPCPKHGGGQQQAQVQMVCPKMFIRNLDAEVAKNISEALSDKYFTVLLQYPTQQYWQGAELLYSNLRDAFSVINSANKILCIDSFGMHAATALGKKPVVCWAGTSPKNLGYKQNINLVMECCDDPECGRPNSFLLDVDWKGMPWDCPLGEPCTRHDEKDVIEALTAKTKKPASKSTSKRKSKT